MLKLETRQQLRSASLVLHRRGQAGKAHGAARRWLCSWPVVAAVTAMCIVSSLWMSHFKGQHCSSDTVTHNVTFLSQSLVTVYNSA